MNRTNIILLLLVAFACNKMYAGSPSSVKQFINHSDWNFVENKGQLAAPDIKYYARPNGASGRGHQGGVNVYCKAGKISFVFTKTEKESDQISEATSQPSGFPLPKAGSLREQGMGLGFGREKMQPSKITINRADLVLLNSNPSAQILASDQQEYYENYYTSGNADSGITNVHTYKTITYKSIYPNIDLVLHAKENGMKYEFVVYPGGKVSDIQMQWNGLENLQMTENGGIEYEVALGKMDESKPVSFQGENFVESDFIKHSNVIGFKVNRYDKEKVLVVDPTLVWGTYFGGSGKDVGFGVATDQLNNLYITGETESLNHIATTGAYQTTLQNGNDDIFIAKFSPKGNLIWGTYFGDDLYDVPNAIKIDHSGNILIAGYITGASGSMGIASSGAYQTTRTGVDVGFLAKFFATGIRNWSTYFGGITNTDTYIADLDIDVNDNIFIAGSTSSISQIATSGAFQTSLAGGPLFQNYGNYDAFVAEFSSIGKISWCSYYGGSGDDWGLGISLEPGGNVYITGRTASAMGIATKGTYQTSYGGDSDAFIAKFNNTGTRILWASYFGGSSLDAGYGVCADGAGNIYVTGTTMSSYGIASSGSYQTNFGGGSIFGGDAFIAKFDDSGNRIWATYYGGSGTDWAGKIVPDVNGNVYITGLTESPNAIATHGAYQTSYGGYIDAFLANFSKSGNIIWATYYGGAGSQYGYDIAIDLQGSVYLTGFTSSNSGIATSNGYQTSYAGNYDAFIAKFSNVSTDAGIDSFISPSGNYCKDTIPVSILLKNYGISTLDSVKISLSINGKLQRPFSWTGKLQTDSTTIVNLGNIAFPPGTDTIKSWTYNPNGVKDSFPGNDTSTTIIQVHALPPANAGPDTILCYDETYTMQGSGGITYTWHPATYLSSATDPRAIAILPNTERYELIVSNAFGCTDSAPVLLKVRPKLTVKAIALNNPICYGNPINLYAIGSGGDSLHYQYQWINDGVSGDSLTEKVFQSGWHKVILSDNCSAVSGTDSVYVTVAQHAKASFSWSPNPYSVEKRPVSLINESTNAISYLWTFGDNDSSKLASPDHIYTDSGYYKVMLIAYGLNNCSIDTAFATIKILDNQVTIYIPNAFSPNGDGINDVFDISGVGIKSYTYNIYNRWGEHLFEATPGHTAWDGTLKGQLVAESIYIYQMDVIDVEGQHHYLSGNITLMR